MRSFPDESRMERSADGTEPIRGGSIGLNRILGYFTQHAAQDHHPAFHASILSAYTLFYNVWAQDKTASRESLEQAFIAEVNVYLEYYDIYLSHTRSRYHDGKKAAVLVYFPRYDTVPSAMRLEPNKERTGLNLAYDRFLRRFSGTDEMVKDMEHLSCFWVRAGDATYPHKEVARKFKEITAHGKSLYGTGDAVSVTTHVPLDFHIASRLRNVKFLERFTGKIKTLSDIRLKTDKDGLLPFTAVTQGVFGDGVMIQPLIGQKDKRLLLGQAAQEKWISRTEEDIRGRICKTLKLSVRELQKFDFV